MQVRARPTQREALNHLFGVPPNTSPGYGYAFYELSEDGSELRFTITTYGLTGSVTAAHFHNAPASVVGPVVFDLAPFLADVQTEDDGGVTFSGASSLADWSIENAAEEIRAGRVYVNLHTAAYPDGEIRGQVILY